MTARPRLPELLAAASASDRRAVEAWLHRRASGDRPILIPPDFADGLKNGPNPEETRTLIKFRLDVDQYMDMQRYGEEHGLAVATLLRALVCDFLNATEGS